MSIWQFILELLITVRGTYVIFLYASCFYKSLYLSGLLRIVMKRKELYCYLRVGARDPHHVGPIAKITPLPRQTEHRVILF